MSNETLVDRLIAVLDKAIERGDINTMQYLAMYDSISK